ncbi:MAG TPA: zf-HC2 domain-containing protein [Candidatus Acidoferrum sp.]|nr:zf-HC2 domain-containing protein [Candidatus Acidoferrum sp.]
MCDVQTKLIAWLDRELSPKEAAEVHRHIKGCQECRGRLTMYKQVSETFDVYCDALVAGKTPHRLSRWVPVLASAVAAAVVIFLAFPQRRIGPPPVLAPTFAATSVPVPAPRAAETVPRKTLRRRHAAPRVQKPAMNWQPTETAVQIAIPAEAMFPPGAMPKGTNFIAELSIAADGSVQQVRLRQ